MDTNIIIAIAVGGLILLLCLLLSIASFSGERFVKEYRSLQKVSTATQYNATIFIAYLNKKYLQNKIKIFKLPPNRGDFYSAKEKVVAVNIQNERSLASFAVIAHEMGHAYQDVNENKLKSFNRLRKAGAFVGKLFLPVLLVGVVCTIFLQEKVTAIIVAGGALLLIIFLAIIIKAKTIAIEKDASDRGLQFLRELLPEEEVKKCKKLLDSARLTYWADLIKLLLSWSGLTSKTEMFS